MMTPVTRSLKVERLTPEAFAPYGRVLSRPTEGGDVGRDDLKVWIGISDVMGLEGRDPILTFLEATRHTLAVNKIERHPNTAEAFIPLEGQSVLVVAPAGDPDDPNDKPDESRLRAFLLDGSCGVFLPRGSWHWVPFPIGETATYILLFAKDLYTEIVDIAPSTLELY